MIDATISERPAMAILEGRHTRYTGTTYVEFEQQPVRPIIVVVDIRLYKGNAE
jgi:hypothetical protein